MSNRSSKAILSAIVLLVVGCTGRRPADAPPSRSPVPVVETPKTMAGPLRMAPAPAANWIGIYVGTVESSGQEAGVVTRLDPSSQGLIGSYMFEEQNAGVQLGTLTDCKASASHQLSCTWHDFYGTGVLELNLSASGDEWSGRWRAANDPQWFMWNGKRQTGKLLHF